MAYGRANRVRWAGISALVAWRWVMFAARCMVF
jgi:hypothetical protein